jgi:excisionase family DNA binding protein
MKPACFTGGQMPLPDKILVHNAARILNCSKRTIRRYIQVGILTAERRGRRAWLIMRADLEHLQRSRRLAW